MAVSRIDQVQENYQSSSTNHQILAQTDLKTASRSGKPIFIKTFLGDVLKYKQFSEF